MKTILILYSCIIFFSLQIHSAKAAYPRNRLYIYLQFTFNDIELKISGVTNDTRKYIDSTIGNTKLRRKVRWQ
ncbi:hypothetical protein KM043_018600 [Ampulex compressa]|nr:hypothetical protein KM043_018600 [Ampulex compressa]